MTTSRGRRNNPGANGEGSTPDYGSELWRMADALRGSMDAAEYKHVVLGLIFLKYISDAFEEARAKLEAEVAQGADPEDPDEYRAQSIFWVPSEARWPKLQAQARQPSIGQAVDDAILVTMTDLSKQADTLGYPPLFRHPQMDSAFFTTNDSARSSS